MLTDYPIRDVRDMQTVAGLVASIGVGQWQSNLNSNLVSVLGNAMVASSNQDVNRKPFWWYGQGNGNTIILFGSSGDAGTAAGLIAGYVNAQLIGPNAYVNTAVAASGQMVIDDLNRLGRDVAGQNVLIAGYSMGGAVAEWLTWQFALLNVQVQCITFGAPRPFGSTQATGIGQTPIARIMTNNDPIPLIPPRVAEYPALLVNFVPAVVSLLAFFVHPHGGFVLDPLGGAPTVADTPPNASIVNAINLAGFLVDQLAQTNGPHSMNTYIAQLGQYVNNHPNTVLAHVPNAPAERPNPVNGRQLNPVARAVEAAIFNQGVVQNAPPFIADPTLLFKAVRNGGIWSVEFGGQTVAVGPDKRRARGLARVGNSLCERLSRQAVVDVPNIVTQFGQYVATASVPGSGVSPAINPTFPLVPGG